MFKILSSHKILFYFYNNHKFSHTSTLGEYWTHEREMWSVGARRRTCQQMKSTGRTRNMNKRHENSHKLIKYFVFSHTRHTYTGRYCGGMSSLCTFSTTTTDDDENKHVSCPNILVTSFFFGLFII